MVEVALNRRAVAERGKRLEYFTIAWNSLEGMVAIISGAQSAHRPTAGLPHGIPTSLSLETYSIWQFIPPQHSNWQSEQIAEPGGDLPGTQCLSRPPSLPKNDVISLEHAGIPRGRTRPDRTNVS